jgi:hypothetical protein
VLNSHLSELFIMVEHLLRLGPMLLGLLGELTRRLVSSWHVLDHGVLLAFARDVLDVV